MKVLFVNPVGVLGGAERVLLANLDSLQRGCPDIQPHLLLMGDGPLADEARRRGVPTTLLPLPAPLAELGEGGRWGVRHTAVAARLLWSYVRRLRGVFAELAPAIIHSNGIKSHLLAALARPRPPLLWHLHDFLSGRALARRALRALRCRARLGLAVSHALARDVHAALPGLPLRVIANAVDLAEFSPGVGAGASLDVQAGLPPAAANTVRVGLVAAYGRWKGHGLFLEAAGRLVQRAPAVPVRFYIIGGPIYQTAGSQYAPAELHALAKQAAIADRVGFIAFQPRVAEIYRALDIVVQASTQPEPFGLTTVEAMACGRAVVVAAHGGSVELFTDGHDALGFAPGDAAMLAALVHDLVRDPERRDRLGANARRTAVSAFDQQRLGPALQSVYRELVPSAPSA